MYRLFISLICLCMLVSPAHASPSSEDASSLINELRKGGYILYVRHGEANVGEDQPGFNPMDCSTQRNLSVRGRDQANKYGEAIRKLNIPITLPVESGPLCRTVQTAEAAFGTQNVTIKEFWLNIYELSKNIGAEDSQKILQEFTNDVEHVPPNHSNRVIIAHSFPSGIGLGNIPYMGTVVVKPLGNNRGYEVIGRLALEDLLMQANM
ncbi:histidine phosphatase family protein [Paenibacillus sp. ACRRY]|uniref:histidine phosphatase family protein n=1 Tax=Paenibacillus sp. ACRRY TaxID=2918208 RepID=UPI001EF672B3|nr:histidine phosphatase family protein [Paenibacillus sp. ACRRY]MCG7381624.1 histidine phosphatase family protein [Paenibacillus sp. ACRRY]